MIKRFEKILSNYLQGKQSLPENELYRYVLMMAVSITAVTVHILFAIFFFCIGSMLMAACHSLGVVVFILCVRLMKHRHYDAAGVLLSLMILFSTLVTIATIGGDNYAILYQLIVLLILLILPFTNKHIPRAFYVLLPCLMVGSYLYDITHIPPQPIGDTNHILAVMNILVVSGGVTAMLMLERFVRSFVSSYQARRLKELEVQANIDPLTGLYNRRYANAFFDTLSHEPASGYCVAIADIDDFKLVNDTWGHDAGDEVLRVLSEIFIAYLRKQDRVVRWGGEEFLLILDQVDVAQAKQLLERTREAVAARVIPAAGQQLRVTITIGVAALDPYNVQDSLALGDKMLYEGKRSGKNKVVG